MADQTIAIIQLGAKQHLVKKGDLIKVMKLPYEQGASFEVDDLLNGEKVHCKLIKHTLGKKIRALVHRPKVRYIRRWGHRDKLSEIEITSIGKLVENPKIHSQKDKKKSSPTTKVISPRSTRKKEEARALIKKTQTKKSPSTLKSPITKKKKTEVD